MLHMVSRIESNLRYRSAFLDFEEMGSRYLIDIHNKYPENKRHVVIGHNKPHHVRIAKAIAERYPGMEVIYYDNSRPSEDDSDINSENIGSITGLVADWLRKMLGATKKPKRQDRPERPLRIPKNLKITRIPPRDRQATTADYVLSLHEFDDPAQSLDETYSFLMRGGGLGVFEYTLGWIAQEANPLDIFQQVFSAENERKVLKEEGLEKCYSSHNKFTEQSLVSLLDSKGFKHMEKESQRTEYMKVNGIYKPRFVIGFFEKH